MAEFVDPRRMSRPAGRRRGALVRAVVLSASSVIALSTAACASGSPAISPQKQADELINAGLKAQSSGQINQALQDYKAALAKNPANQYADYDLGVIYQQRNDAADASNYYSKALLIDPTYTPALFNLAIVETPSDPAMAISLYDKILKIKPNDADTLFNLGLLLISQNQAASGHADLTRAIAINPSLASRVPAGITP